MALKAWIFEGIMLQNANWLKSKILGLNEFWFVCEIYRFGQNWLKPTSC